VENQQHRGKKFCILLCLVRIKMTSRILTRERILEIMKCYDHLPEPENLEVTILKGHLLIEIRLKEYIGKKLPNPQSCDLDRFKFSQLINIAHGLCSSHRYDSLWQSTQNLNMLRNRLSHELDDVYFMNALNNFLDYHSKHFFQEDSGCRNIHSCIVSVYSSFIHLIAEDTEPISPANV